MKSIIVIVTTYILLLGENCLAENRLSFEFNNKIGLYTVEDSRGSTDHTLTWVPTLKVAYALPHRGRKVVAGLEYYDFELDASTSNIGQKVRGVGLLGAYEHRFNIARGFRPWVGIGMTAVTARYTNRHTINADGFLNKTFSNRDAVTINGTLYAQTFFDLGGPDSSWQWGAGVFLDYPFGNSLGGAGISLLLQYQ